MPGCGNAIGLLATGGVVWATNVIAFGLWYWDLDREWRRRSRAHRPQAGPALFFAGDAAPRRHLGHPDQPPAGRQAAARPDASMTDMGRAYFTRR